MATTFEFTRWRGLHDPIDPADPIQPDSPRYNIGHIPPQFVVLLWNGFSLEGPMKFDDQHHADRYLKIHRSITHYLVIPKP